VHDVTPGPEASGRRELPVLRQGKGRIFPEMPGYVSFPARAIETLTPAEEAAGLVYAAPLHPDTLVLRWETQVVRCLFKAHSAGVLTLPDVLACIEPWYWLDQDSQGRRTYLRLAMSDRRARLRLWIRRDSMGLPRFIGPSR
jgi:hypothetical protein